MSLPDVVAAIMFVGVIAYAVFGGADFGSGIWDLTAGGDEAGAPLRSLIDRVIGPVWEANHVWLIFVLVWLWSGFPEPFAAVMETLYLPFALAGLGIVLRGSTFAFRKFAPTLGSARLFGILFAVSSVATPFVFGAIAGAIASGRVPLDGSGDPISSWTGPTSIVGGVLAVLTCAFLAAAFLTAEAEHRGQPDVALACRRRAIGAGVVTGAVALVAILVLREDAPTLFDGLTGRAVPLIAISGIAGLLAMVTLWQRRLVLARVSAIVAVVAVVAGWGVAQYDWLLTDVVTIDDGAGARPTLWALVIVFLLAGVLVLPPLGYLFWLTQRPGWVARDQRPSMP
ncbi:MAG: cytochrome d ubiquinol oxidase subunit II [Ilumatobacteraceae bacterium]|nr:cytochrome d ubiquinol oxidase subunit II [Ilumatobacteraceae bacterium]